MSHYSHLMKNNPPSEFNNFPNYFFFNFISEFKKSFVLKLIHNVFLLLYIIKNY